MVGVAPKNLQLNEKIEIMALEEGFGLKSRFKRGWRITKLGIHVVKADPELIFYVLFTVFAPIIFWSLNGYLIGREYFYMAAKRHLGRDNALSAFCDHRFRVWMCGVILVLPMSVPLLNLLVPVLAAASFTHLFQWWMADRNGQRNLNHPR